MSGSFVTTWTVACQAPLSMMFPRQKHWSGLPSPPDNLPDPGFKPASPALQVNSSPLSHLESPKVGNRILLTKQIYSLRDQMTVLGISGITIYSVAHLSSKHRCFLSPLHFYTGSIIKFFWPYFKNIFWILLLLSISTILPQSVVKNPLANAGDVGSIRGSGRTPGEGNGNPLQYSCLESPMDRGGWRAIVHRVRK